ncbi:sugar transferase, partial [Priestia megaterium]|uniref:sugar transferase n=1 Tax=Priestia megaterium TaxID=1404 RepID=UPI002FFD9F35
AIVLFVFNRVKHTNEVLEGLNKNNVKKLYIFCDGPRTTEESHDVELVKDSIKKIDWCEVEAIYQDTNIGLAESVINGVNTIFSKGYDSVIILEDDCVPKKGFISYMKEALNYYKDNSQVMHISAFGLPLKKHTASDVYFTPYPCSWGWATWKEYWEDCDFYQIEEYNALLENKEMRKKFNYPGEAFSEFLKFQLDGKINSWLIRWYYYIFSKGGSCLWAYNSLLENKGFDGSGAHTNKIDRFNQRDFQDNYYNEGHGVVWEDSTKYNEGLIKEFRRYFMGKKISERFKTVIYLLTRIINRKVRRGS